jgi:hypothetical protein
MKNDVMGSFSDGYRHLREFDRIEQQQSSSSSGHVEHANLRRNLPYATSLYKLKPRCSVP